jgi:hypothetical protein
MDVKLAEDVITLSEEKLIDKGLALMGLTDCKPVQTPLSVSVQLLDVIRPVSGTHNAKSGGVSRS